MLNRFGKYFQSGNIFIVIDKGDNFLFMVSNSFEEIWKQFSEYGYLILIEKLFGVGFYGVVFVNIIVKFGKENILIMVLGWFYFNRDFIGMLRF